MPRTHWREGHKSIERKDVNFHVLNMPQLSGTLRSILSEGVVESYSLDAYYNGKPAYWGEEATTTD
jgi:hypothetical protein